MPRTKKGFMLFYEHLTLVGKYVIPGEEEDTVEVVSLGPRDIILLDRVISFEENKVNGQRQPLDFYMCNRAISNQMGMSISTASNCIRRLKKVGLVTVEYQRGTNGVIAEKRIVHTCKSRINQLVKLRREEPVDVMNLLPNEADQTANEPVNA